MKTRTVVQLVCLVGILTAAPLSASAQAARPPKTVAPTGHSTVAAEVRQMLAEYFRTVERHELPKFLAFFAEGEDLTVFEDKEMYDWKAFVAFAEGFFQQVAEIKFDLEKCTVNPLSPGVAVATGVFRGTGRSSAGEPVIVHNAYTFVLVKQDGRWRIKHVHESSL